MQFMYLQAVRSPSDWLSRTSRRSRNAIFYFGDGRNVLADDVALEKQDRHIIPYRGELLVRLGPAGAPQAEAVQVLLELSVHDWLSRDYPLGKLLACGADLPQ